MSARQCIVCDRRSPFPTLFERDGYRMVRCECGLAFQDPAPGPEALRSAYYHDQEFTEALFGELRELTLRNARQKLEFLRAAGALSSGMRLLDVGASSGAWLEIAAEAGIEGVGVELGAATAARARDRGLDVREGTLADAIPDLQSGFDLITFWDVLEHVPDPRHELRLARRLLRPAGLVAATVPNIDGLYPRLTYRLLARRTGVWEYPELPVHLYDFAPGTISGLLAGTGFDVERIRTYATPYGFYRSTSLSPERLGPGRRSALLRAAFAALRLVAYPLAALTDRGNAMFVLARAIPEAVEPDASRTANRSLFKTTSNPAASAQASSGGGPPAVRLGGIQEETTYLGVPCFTLRDNTERPVTVRAGTNTLLGLDPARIASIPGMLGGAPPNPQPPPLWDGHAAERIIDVVADW